MSYRKLLVGLADPATAPRVLAVACALAKAQEAHLLVVHVDSPIGRGDGAPPEELAERLRGIYDAYSDDGSFSSEWRVVADHSLSAVGALVELGNACDALVLGQRHAREAGRSGYHLGEHVVGVTARPVVLVPESVEEPYAARRILLAWDDGAISTRAAYDALPLLQHADHVRVHRFSPPREERRRVSGVAERFAGALSRHGVPLELSHSRATRAETGEEILALAEDDGSDLIVMGCHVHTRVRQLLLGDTTRHVFAHADRAVLMGG